MEKYLFVFVAYCLFFKSFAQTTESKLPATYPFTLSADRANVLDALLQKDASIIRNKNRSNIALYISKTKTLAPSIIMQSSDTLSNGWIDFKEIRLWKKGNAWCSENPSENERTIEAGNIGWILRKIGAIK